MSEHQQILLREAGPEDRKEWLDLRCRLFPDFSRPQLERELDEILKGGEHAWGLKQTCLVMHREGEPLFGFIEVNLRHFAPGCETQPVGYIESWYVLPHWRRKGVGRTLVRAAEGWARNQGCKEMASDCDLDNETSEKAHRALGYREVNRVIEWAKRL